MDEHFTFGHATTSDGARVFYAFKPGHGTPLVAVDSYWYMPVATQVRSRVDVGFYDGMAAGSPWAVFDWRGKGGSSALDGPVSLDRCLLDLEAVVGVLGARIDLYAYEQSTHLAAAFAARFPGRVRRLLLHGARRFINPGKDRRSARFLQRIAADPRGLFEDVMMMTFREDVPLPEIEELAASWERGFSQAAWASWRAAFDNSDLKPAANGCTAPALVVALDVVLAEVTEAAALFPVSRLTTSDERRFDAASGRMLRQLWDEFIPPVEAPSRAVEECPEPSSPLSARESQVLGLIVEGLSSAAIADRLGIAPATAVRHIANIYTKLDVNNRALAIAAAHRMRLAGLHE